MNEPHATITLEQYDKLRKKEESHDRLSRLRDELETEIFKLSQLAIGLSKNLHPSVNVRGQFEAAGFDMDAFFKHYERK